MTRPISMLKKWIAPLHVCDFTEKLLHWQKCMCKAYRPERSQGYWRNSAGLKEAHPRSPGQRRALMRRGRNSGAENWAPCKSYGWTLNIRKYARTVKYAIGPY